MRIIYSWKKDLANEKRLEHGRGNLVKYDFPFTMGNHVWKNSFCKESANLNGSNKAPAEIQNVELWHNTG
jgi:hypothetical protein